MSACRNRIDRGRAHPPRGARARRRRGRRRRGAGAHLVRPARARTRPSATACRPSATSSIRPTSSISTTSIRTRRKAALFSQIGPARQYNQNFLTFNSLNSFILKGDAAHGMELTFATLMARAQRRARRDVWACGARGAHLGRRPDLSLPAAAGGAIPRRHAAHRAGRRLLARRPEGEGPPDHHASSLRDMVGVEATDDATVVVRFAPERGRDVPLFVAQLPIFSRAYYASQPFEESTSRCRSARAPTRSGASRPAASSNTSASRTGGAPTCRSSRGQNNFDIVRYEFYRDRDVGFRGLHRQELPVPRGVHLAHLGDALRFPGDQGRPREARGAARRHAVRRAGLVHQYAARQVQGPRACARR